LGYNDSKKRLLNALDQGLFLHVQRGDIDEKNKLAVGEVSVATIKQLVLNSQGRDYSASQHHQDSSVMVHVIQTKGWYIKFYFLDEITMFISVHWTKSL